MVKPTIRKESTSSDQTNFAWVLECDGETLDGMRKQAQIEHDEITFTIESDEGVSMGGSNTAPWPLDYFVASILF